MNNSHPGTEETLRKELLASGARDYEVVALTLDPGRGLAALRYAVGKNVNHPVAYAIACFDNPEWAPKVERKPVATNVSVDVKCAHCGGDRFVVVTDGAALYEETYAPCAYCNAKANTARYVDNERHVTVPR